MQQQEGEVAGMQEQRQGKDADVADPFLLLNYAVLARSIELEGTRLPPLSGFSLLLQDHRHAHLLLLNRLQK